MANRSAIGYIRVSSKMQGKSGLGLEAQQCDIERFCDMNDIGNFSLVAGKFKNQ